MKKKKSKRLIVSTQVRKSDLDYMKTNMRCEKLSKSAVLRAFLRIAIDLDKRGYVSASLKSFSTF